MLYFGSLANSWLATDGGNYPQEGADGTIQAAQHSRRKSQADPPKRIKPIRDLRFKNLLQAR
jgi:hypothetical protein